jgi:two-component system, LytTR family, response regulator LytT
MIKYLILEDEEPAAKRLQKMIADIAPDFELVAAIDTVEEAVQWLGKNQHPDLAFFDIQLADGLSFEVFSKIAIKMPVVFVTAFDRYAIDAFKVNSIDYLLKPLKKEELERAIQKFNDRNSVAQHAPIDVQSLLQLIQPKRAVYKERFVVKYGEHLKTIETKEAAYFYTENRVNFMMTYENKRYIIDHNLDELEAVLDPKRFFRINRQFIICIHAIAEMLTYSKSRVLVHLNPSSKLETIVSTERSAEFKSWLGGE